MVYARLDGNGAEFTDHFDKARHRRFEHQFAELRSGRGRVATNPFLGEATPPILPAIGAGFGMIPVEVF